MLTKKKLLTKWGIYALVMVLQMCIRDRRYIAQAFSSLIGHNHSSRVSCSSIKLVAHSGNVLIRVGVIHIQAHSRAAIEGRIADADGGIPVSYTHLLPPRLCRRQKGRCRQNSVLSPSRSAQRR